jgi:hypothetical protein
MPVEPEVWMIYAGSVSMRHTLVNGQYPFRGHPRGHGDVPQGAGSHQQRRPEADKYGMQPRQRRLDIDRRINIAAHQRGEQRDQRVRGLRQPQQSAR